MSEFNENKTEDPTPKRRENARREGRVVFSGELSAGIVLLCLAIALPYLQTLWVGQFGNMVLESHHFSAEANWSIPQLSMMFRWALVQMLMIAGPAALGVWLVSLGSAQAQIGGIATTELTLNWERLWSPGNLSRLVSPEAFVTAGQTLLKVMCALVIGVVAMYQYLPALGGATATAQSTPAQDMQFVNQLVLQLAIAALCWGALDYGLKWWRHENKLRMTKQELKQEHKDESGDPQIKGRRRQMHRDALTRKSLKSVPEASVVLRNPTHFAVALKYERNRNGAPIVVAKGKGAMALRIVAIAEEHNVPVLERKPLARALYFLADIGKEIPPDLYHAVAQVLAYVFRMGQSRRLLK